jgi:hypothetical protein
VNWIYDRILNFLKEGAILVRIINLNSLNNDVVLSFQSLRQYLFPKQRHYSAYLANVGSILESDYRETACYLG